MSKNSHTYEGVSWDDVNQDYIRRRKLKRLLKALKRIRWECKLNEGCDTCDINFGYGCPLAERIPCYWELDKIESRIQNG